MGGGQVPRPELGSIARRRTRVQVYGHVCTHPSTLTRAHAHPRTPTNARNATQRSARTCARRRILICADEMSLGAVDVWKGAWVRARVHGCEGGRMGAWVHGCVRAAGVCARVRACAQCGAVWCVHACVPTQHRFVGPPRCGRCCGPARDPLHMCLPERAPQQGSRHATRASKRCTRRSSAGTK